LVHPDLFNRSNQITDRHDILFSRFKLILTPNPNAETANLADDEDSESIIKTKAFEKGVLALPGTVFLPNGRKTGYVRASFSVIEESDMGEACRRLREVVLDARGDAL